MKIINELCLKIGGKEKSVFFGIPETEEEAGEMFHLRYYVYNLKGYLNSNIDPDLLDRDEYDLEHKCYYLTAKIDERVIGTVRLIIDNFLPTERECFEIQEPTAMKKIPRGQRGEISRLIVIPYDKNNKQYLPRNIILLFLIKSVFTLCSDNNILGGYSFVTEKLYKKIQKLKIPVHILRNHKLVYSQEGLLYPYFHQKGNPIIPIFYMRDEIEQYINKIFNKKSLFARVKDNKYILKQNLYNQFLRLLKII